MIEEKESPMSIGDKELVARARTGDPSASEELVSRYQDKAYAIAYNMCCGDSEEAKEITQEAFLRAFRSLKSFRGKSSFYTWFYRILVTTCLDWRRRQSRLERIFYFWRRDHREKAPLKEEYKEYPEPQEHSNPMTALNNKQLAQEIRKAIQSLPARQRMAFQLKVLNGMKIREIAQIMGAAEGTVKSHLFRATHFLRDVLQEWNRP
ncbi:MAG: sigma-70 family RNA polymerase sigma factor [Candidatus Omnitrophica bacterium]|nr:sigma-70 family RNA polymerase sigma factor [Candidatus Omnitrophota bacterium]